MLRSPPKGAHPATCEPARPRLSVMNYALLTQVRGRSRSIFKVRCTGPQ